MLKNLTVPIAQLLFSPRSCKSRKRISLSYVFTTVALSSLLSACGQSTTANNEDNYYHAAKLLTIKPQQHYTINREFTGFVTSSQHGNIGFELPGKLAHINVDIGSEVQAGDLIAELDTELLAIDKQQLNAQFAELKARLRLNQSSFKRQKLLEKDGYTSQQRLDELLAERDTINASTARLEASLAAVETRISKSTLIAPFNGTISAKYVNIGTVIAAGTPIIKLLNNTRMEARIGVPARLLSTLAPGSQHILTIDKEEINTEVIAIGADISPITRTVPVRLSLANTQSVDGSLVKLLVDEQIQQAGYWVPLNSITDGMRGLWTVYAVIDAEINNEAREKNTEKLYRIEARAVQIEYTLGDDVFISADLDNIHWIVADGLHRFVPGQIIRSSTL